MGTPGYMATEVSNGVYTARSEVYSLGVVLLELLTGRCVGARTATELRDAAEDGEGAATVAVSAEAGGVWTPAAAAALAALALACVASRAAKRPTDMRAVIEGLRGVRANLAAAAPLAACGICLEDVPAVSGALCKAATPAPRHFICHGCLQQHVDARLEPRLLAAAKGAVPCHAGAAACKAEPWALEDLTEHLDKATLVAYGRALRYQLYDAAEARRLAEEAFAARERAANDARLALAERVRQHRLVIAERLLLLRCPRCAVVFSDYSGCNALVCGKCGCGFCAVCLKDCGRDAHPHHREAHGDYFDRALFERTHRERRAHAVAAAVRALAGEGAKLQRALVAELAKADLRDLGIGAEDVLREAGVTAIVVAGDVAAVPASGLTYCRGCGGRGVGIVKAGEATCAHCQANGVPAHAIAGSDRALKNNGNTRFHHQTLTLALAVRARTWCHQPRGMKSASPGRSTHSCSAARSAGAPRSGASACAAAVFARPPAPPPAAAPGGASSTRLSPTAWHSRLSNSSKCSGESVPAGPSHASSRGSPSASQQ